MSDEKDKLHGFKTACKTCIFSEVALGDSIYDGEHQTGCLVGRLDKFKEQERANKSEDDFYIIDGVCNTCRGEAWLNQNLHGDAVSTVLREVQLTVDIVLYSVDEAYDELPRKLEQAISACVKQNKIPAKRIVVVVKSDNLNFTELYNLVQDMTSPYDLPFQLVRIVEDEADMGRSIEMGVDKCKSQYTAIFNVNDKIPTNFIERLNDLVNNDLQRVLLIEPITNYHGTIFTTVAFDMLGKNFYMPIFDKIKETAAEQEKDNLILTWSALWNRK